MMHESLGPFLGGMTFLQTAKFKSRSVKGLGNIIRQAAKDAKLPNKSAHGLRKNRLTHVVEHGGSARAIMAWGGHKTLAEAQKYTNSAQLKFPVTGTKQKQNDANQTDTPVDFQKNRYPSNA